MVTKNWLWGEYRPDNHVTDDIMASAGVHHSFDFSLCHNVTQQPL